MKIATIEPITVHVSSKTKWFFVKMVSTDGITGYGEASLFGWEPLLHAYLKIAASVVLDREINDASEITSAFPDRSAGRVSDSIVSALELAFWDIRGQELEAPLHELWGTRQGSATFYANINRGTTDRTAEGWASRARAAVEAGFRAIKIAPLDGLRVRGGASPDQLALLDEAISKVAAVSDAVGEDAKVMVDCHWRLDPESARYALQKLAALGVDWLEAPFPETFQSISALSRLRDEAIEANVTLAGAELQYGLQEYEPFIVGGAFQVIMPDLRWCGGASEGLRIAKFAEEFGIEVAPHNSAGPILGASSLHFGVSISNLHSIELQRDESPLYFRSIGSNHIGLGTPRVGMPASPGIGLTLDETAISSLPAGTSDWSQVIGQPGSSAYG